MNEDDILIGGAWVFPEFGLKLEDVDGFYRREALFLRACFHHCKLPVHLGLMWYCPQLFEGPAH